jgi:hypothetical protein
MFGEENEQLWRLAAAPLIWALHFLGSYATASIFCAKLAGPELSLAPVRVALAIYTVFALLPIALIGKNGWMRSRRGRVPLTHHQDAAEDRHRFLGFATMLLSGLSAIAVIYSALTALFVRTC